MKKKIEKNTLMILHSYPENIFLKNNSKNKAITKVSILVSFFSKKPTFLSLAIHQIHDTPTDPLCEIKN